MAAASAPSAPSAPGTPRNLVLIGPMGAGKSTVGRLVAHRLGLRYVDTDALVCQATGRTIAELFATQGEAAFRALEAEAVAEVCRRSGLVISLGGGAVTDPDNVARLRSSAVVVMLDGSPAELAARVERGVRQGSRPLLAGVDDVEAKLAELRAARAEAYAAAAHLTIDTDGQAPAETADAVVAALAAHAARHEPQERR